MVGVRVGYLYRDAGNYKFRSEFALRGIISEDYCREFMIDREYFVPESIGLASLRPNCCNEDDHQLHEIEYFIADDGVVSGIDANEFVLRMRNAAQRGWFNG